jgi:hypothetical protein
MKNIPNIANELSVQIEDLEPIVLSITNNQRAIISKGEVMRRTEFARSHSGITPASDEFSV